MTTSLLADRQEALTTPPEIDDELLQIAGDGLTLVLTGGPTRSIHFDQVTALRGFRLNSQSQRQLEVLVDAEPRTIELNRNADELLELSWKRPTQLEVDGKIVAFAHGRFFEIVRDEKRGSVGGAAASGSIVAPMPGKVTAVEVSQGEKVSKGQRLLTLEAMKMEHGLTAPFNGTVAELNTTAGAQVVVDAVLARIEADA